MLNLDLAGRSKRRKIPAAATKAWTVAAATAIPEAAGPAAATEADHASTSEAVRSIIAFKAFVEATKKTVGNVICHGPYSGGILCV